MIALDIYRFCLFAGVTGIACMAVLGMGHSSFGHHAHGIGHGSAHGGAHGAGHGAGHGSHGHGAQGQHGSHQAQSAQSSGAFLGFLLGFLSPRVLFSLSLGFGLSGVLLKPVLAMEPARWLLALCGAMMFEGLFVRPLWNLAFRFASNPARTLETMVFEEGRAVTDFDASGHGLISIDMDGQVMQVLGVLKPQDREFGTRVRTGERLFIEDIDTARNRCTVSRLRS